MAEKKTTATRKTSKKEAVASAPATAPSAPPDAVYAYIVGAEGIGSLADACRSVSCPVYIVADPSQVDELKPDSSRPIDDNGREVALCIWNHSTLATYPTVADLKAKLETSYTNVTKPGE